MVKTKYTRIEVCPKALAIIRAHAAAMQTRYNRRHVTLPEALADLLRRKGKR